jgi:hypothetical protein
MQWAERTDMLRVLSKFLMGLALAGFLIPVTVDNADAGRRYKSSGKSNGYSMRRSQRGYKSSGRFNGRSMRRSHRRYKSRGEFNGYSMRRSHRRYNSFAESIPSSYLYYGYADNYGYANNYVEPKSYRGGPKIIDVQKTLRARQKQKSQD